jgi:hypothetical protein
MTERGSAHAIGLHCDCAQWHAVTTANVAVPAKRRVQGRFDYDMELVNGSIVLLGVPSIPLRASIGYAR